MHIYITQNETVGNSYLKMYLVCIYKKTSPILYM